MPDSSRSFVGLRTWLIFLVLLAGLLWFLSTDFRPRPLYYKVRLSGEFLYCTSGSPVVATVSLPQKGVCAIELAAIIPKPSVLKVTVLNAKRGEVIATQSFQEGGMLKLMLPSNEAKRLSLQFESDALTKELAPRLHVSAFDPDWRIKVAADGQQGLPFLRFYFSWPTRKAVWAWALVPLAGLLCWRRIISPAAFLVTLGLCTVLLSVLLWENDYAFLNYNRADADDYGECATHLASYLKHPAEENPKAAAFLRRYPHTTNTLASAIMAIPIALGLSSRMTYLFFSSLCGFGALCIFARILQKHLSVSLPVLLISLTLFATHMHHIRAFSRAVTDEFGILLVISMLKLLMDRAETATRRQSLIISAMIFILPVARPQGVALAPIFLLGVMACDAWREKELAPWRRIRSAFKLGIIPLILLAALYIGFDWQHNFKLQLAKAAKSDVSGGEYFGLAFLGILQWMPILWLCAKTTMWKRPPVWILTGWGCFYVALLIAVDAPMKSRHFLPLLPLIILTGYALETVRPKLRTTAWSLVVLAISANLAAIIYQLHVLLLDDRELRALIGTF